MVNKIVTTQVTNKDGNKEKYRTYTWDCADGLKNVSVHDGTFMSSPPIGLGDDGTNPFQGDALAPLLWLEKPNQPAAALGFPNKSGNFPMDNTVIFLKDYHTFLAEKCQSAPVFIRKIKNLLQEFKACSKTLVILSPIVSIPIELDKDIVVIDYKLPGRDELHMILKGVCEGPGAIVPTGATLKELLDAALGLTLNEAENAFSVSLIQNKAAGGFDPEVVRKEKAAIVKKSGMLEVVETDATLADIGGLEILKDYVRDSAANFTDEARTYGINPIKGMLFLGVSGCGKSLTAKTVANEWKRTLLRLDMGKVYGKYVGESEGNMQRCLDVAGAVAPCCLWMDEMEKGLSGSKAGNNNTHETTQRVMQMLLTWMQDKKEDVVLICTANSVNSLPPELLRSGRIDGIFWVDLPDSHQRLEILKIHLRKVKRNPELFSEAEFKQLICACEGYTGAEIECWVQEALKYGFKKGHKPDPTVSDFLETVGNVTPIVRLMKNDIDEARQWAKTRGARNASIVREETSGPVPTRVRKVHSGNMPGPMAS